MYKMKRKRIILTLIAVFIILFFAFLTPISVKNHNHPKQGKKTFLVKKLKGKFRTYNFILPSVKKIKHGDLIAFYDTQTSDTKLSKREVLVRRVVALPGDIIKIDNKKVYINDKQLPENYELFFEYRLSLDGEVEAENIFKGREIYHIKEIQENRAFNITCNNQTASEIAQQNGVVNIRLLSTAKGKDTNTYFPKDQYFLWNKDYFGPIAVPRAEVTIMLNFRNAAAYKQLIEVFEGHKMFVSQTEVKIENNKINEYRCEGNYYFVMSDDRDYGEDSRHFGFVPANYIIGKVVW